MPIAEGVEHLMDSCCSRWRRRRREPDELVLLAVAAAGREPDELVLVAAGCGDELIEEDGGGSHASGRARRGMAESERESSCGHSGAGGPTLDEGPALLRWLRWWWRLGRSRKRQAASASGTFGGSCWKCGEQGHMAADCPAGGSCSGSSSSSGSGSD